MLLTGAELDGSTHSFSANVFPGCFELYRYSCITACTVQILSNAHNPCNLSAAPLLYHSFWSLDYGLAAPFTTIMIFLLSSGCVKTGFQKIAAEVHCQLKWTLLHGSLITMNLYTVILISPLWLYMWLPLCLSVCQASYLW